MGRERATPRGQRPAAPGPSAPAAGAGPEAWILGAVAAGLPLAFSTAFADSHGLPKLLLLGCGAAACWAAIAWARRGARRTPVDLPWLALGAASLLSFVLAPDRYLGLVGIYSQYAHGVAAYLLCGALFFAAAWSDGPGRRDFPARAGLAAGGLVGGYAILQGIGIEPFAGVDGRLPVGRAGSTLGDPVSLGACLSLLLPFALCRAKASSAWERAWAAVCGALILGGLAASFSRGAWLGALCALGCQGVLAGWIRPGLWSPRRRIAAAGACALLAGGVFLAAAHRRPVGESDSARFELWASLGIAIRERPWLGGGPDSVGAAIRKHRRAGFMRALGGSSQTQVNAHNDLLQVLVTLGVFGLAAYLWLLYGLGLLAREALADESARDYAAAAVAGLASLFVAAKFNPVPLAALGLASLYAGLLARGGREAEGRLGRIGSWSACAACAACAALSLRLACADRSFQISRELRSSGRFDLSLDALREAIRRNPYETHYRQVLARALYKAAVANPDPKRRQVFLAEAAESGAEGMRLRPSDPEGYLLHGTYLMLLKTEGGPDRLSEAEAALDAAAGMDPFFLPLLENRWKLARLRGNLERAERLKLDYERAALLSGGR